MKRVLNIALLILLSGCTFKDHAVTLNSGSTSTEKIYNGVLTVKDANGIIESFGTVTGISPAWDFVNFAYGPFATDIKAFREFMPPTGSAQEISSESLRGTLALAGAFCKRLVDKENVLVVNSPSRTFFTEVDFTKAPSFVPDLIRKTILLRFTQKAWFRLPTDLESQTLLAGMRESENEVDGVPQGAINNQTYNLMIYGCTAVLSAPDSIRN